MKDKNTAGILAFFLGGFGAHKFYLNRPLQGILYFIFCWTLVPSVLAFFESLTYFFNNQEWFDNKYNSKFRNVTYVRDENPSVDLEKVASLYEKGYITKEEFDEKKTVLLKKIS